MVDGTGNEGMTLGPIDVEPKEDQTAVARATMESKVTNVAKETSSEREVVMVSVRHGHA